MRFNMFARAAFAASAIALTASTSSAQTWQVIDNVQGTGSNFWNNQSDDQNSAAPCNIGAVLTGVATNATCVNETPANLLPLVTNPMPNNFLGISDNASGFYFGAGYWQVTLLGTIAGANPGRTWRILDNNSNMAIATLTTAGTSTLIHTNTGFYFDINAWAPANTMYNSKTLVNGESQFSVFTRNGIGPTVMNGVARIDNTGDARAYYVGMEDNACTTGMVAARQCPNVDGYQQTPSDFDYNDVTLKITAVPEPSTYALMGAGMLGIAGFARRRRNNA